MPLPGLRLWQLQRSGAYLAMQMEIVFPGNRKVDAVYKGFTVKTDQPVKEGGDGTATEPFDLFLASIGTCAGIYALSFCRQRKLSHAGLKIVLAFDRNEKKHMVETIRIDIQLPAGFPEKYRPAVVRAVKLCAVKRHLENPPEFEFSTTLSG